MSMNNNNNNNRVKTLTDALREKRERGAVCFKIALFFIYEIFYEDFILLDYRTNMYQPLKIIRIIDLYTRTHYTYSLVLCY